jgi:hypothetical protein
MPTNKTPDLTYEEALDLLRQLTRATRERRHETETAWLGVVWEGRPANTDECLRYAAELVVFDDIYQDLLMRFLPLQLSKDPLALATTLANDLARYTGRGQSMLAGNCPQHEEHETGSLETTLHRAQGRAYLDWSLELLTIIEEFRRW